MEVGESSKKDVSWIPTTPLKPILQRTVPICAAGEGNFLKTSLGVSSHDCYCNSGAACVHSSPGEGANMKLQEQGESAARSTSNGNDSARTCVRPTFDAVSSGENMRFVDLLALAEAASVHSTTIHPGSNNGVKNPFVPISRSQSDPLPNLTSTLLSHQNVCLQQTPVITINDNTREPQDTYTGCCMKNISQFAPPTPDKAIGGESRLVAGMQINVVEDKNVPDTMLDNNKTSNNKELSEHVIESSVAAVSTPLKENHNPDKGSSRDFDLNQPPLPKQRRKKHRPKVITEGKPRGTRKPVTPKPVQSKENPTKRKYVRKKGLNKTSTTPPTEVTGEPTLPEPTKKSCRRSLNFEIGEPPRNENSVPRKNVTVDLDKGIDVVAEEIQAAPSTYLSNINHLGANPKASSKKNNKRKGRVATQDGHEKQERQSGQHDFNSSSGGNLTTGLHMGVTKRKHSASTEHVDTSCMNLIGVHYNELDAYQTRYYWVQFPNVQKKRRSDKGLASNTSTTSVSPTKDVRLATYPEEDASIHLNASNSKCFISCEYKAAEVPFTFEAMDRDIHDKSQAFEGIFSLCQSQTRPTKRRSRTSTRFRDFATLTTTKNFNILPSHFTKQLSNSDRQTLEDAQRSLTGIDALVAETSAVLTKKKRTMKKKTYTPGSSAHSSRYKMQQHRKFLLDSYHLSSAKTLDSAHQITWENVHIMDALAEKFRRLDIHKVRDIASHKQKAIVPYNQQNLKDNTNVHVDGTIIPFEGAFDPIRKRRPRPKVDLDEETDKVWKLLMLDINSHGIDGTDEDKAKWWEEERRVFRGRADSFIARMHLVQGDRRFSQWKGSVVDSVIGVFLTQNVSDHLSSSAFMSLAARFPLKPTNQCKIHNEEGTSLVVSEPQVLMMEPNGNTKWDDKILNPSICYQSSVTLDIEHSEEKETVNSNDSSRTPGSIISLTDESNCRQLKTDEGNTKERLSSTSRSTGALINQEGHGKPCYGGAGKESIDIVSSQCSGLSSQISGDFSIDQNIEKIGSCSDSNSEVEDPSSIAKYNIYNNPTCFSKLLEMAKSTVLHEVNSRRFKLHENCKKADDLPNGSNVIQGSLEASITPGEYTLKLTPNSGVPEVNCFDSFKAEASSCGFSNSKDGNDMNKSSPQTRESGSQAVLLLSQSMPSKLLLEQSNNMQQHFLHSSAQTQDLKQKATESDSGGQNYALRNDTTEINAAPVKPKGRRPAKEKKEPMNWDNLRVQAQVRAGKREKTANTLDSIDWDAVRCAHVNEIADAIKERGMNNMLAERIKNFLNRLVEEHGGIDLEWLRDVPPDQAKEYLLSIRGLGLKSVECVRLLTLHHLAFPVDTNVGRIAVRLGWVPLQPLPESLQLHLLELYPVLESIQKYLWPRLCKLDQRTLYELHYQMITFGKVFCTKSKPNCNACPMRGECRHFASAFASARLALPGPEQRSIVSAAGNIRCDQNQSVIIGQLPLPLPEHKTQTEETQQKQVEAKSDQNQSVIIGQLPLHLPEHQIQTEGTQQKQLEAKSEISTCQPIIEEPATPETECTQALENDIEDAFYEDTCEIPTIKLNIEEFTLNLQNYMQGNMELQDEMSKALVALTPEAASIPAPKLKNVSRLRTEHCVYELPDLHPLLEGWDEREPDDPCKYLLAIWTPGETATSIQPPESRCSSQEYGQLCNDKECFSCNTIREANLQKVRGTILIPCRTAMRGSFPLNGTYFQVNEVFADHNSSLDPIAVPRSWIWNLNRRTVYFGTSIPSIFKGLSTPEIQQCFWRGHVCVRGFDRETRAPRPLMARLHFPASKLAKTKDKTSDE